MKLAGGDRWIIDQIVGRLHVGTSDREVIRELWRRFRKARKGRPVGRLVRRAAYRYALRSHRNNRELYVDVMRGTV